MIRVTVELVSAVQPSRSRILGVAEIANVGGDARLGDYTVELVSGATKELWRSGVVRGFPRLVRGPWDLLYCALAATVGDRNRRGRSSAGPGPGANRTAG